MEGTYGTHNLAKYTTIPLFNIILSFSSNLLFWEPVLSLILHLWQSIYKTYPVMWKFAENYHKHLIKWGIL